MKRALLALPVCCLACGLAVQAQTPAASSSSAASEPQVPTQREVFATHCPARIRTLLGAAMPGSPASGEAIQSICACADGQLGAAGDLSANDPLPKAVSLAALNCAKPTITARFSLYLDQQGWKPTEITRFASCFADRHWKETFEAGLLSRQAKGADLKSLWAACATEVGHSTTPTPP